LLQAVITSILPPSIGIRSTAVESEACPDAGVLGLPFLLSFGGWDLDLVAMEAEVYSPKWVPTLNQVNVYTYSHSV
jgi:hypothetical protein